MKDRINYMGRRAMIKQLCGIGLSVLAWPSFPLKLQNSNLQSLIRYPSQAIAIGSGACTILDLLIEAGVQHVKTVLIGSDARCLKVSQADIKIQIGEELCRGFGCNGDPVLGRQSALEEETRIRGALRSSRTTVIMACLGGGTGTGAGPLVAEWTIRSEAETFAVVTMPFKFEGKRRYEQALHVLDGFRRWINLLHVHSNEVAPGYGIRPITEVYNRNDEAIVASCKTFIRKALQSDRLSS
jgi:cell division GTPase FtsZ